MRVKKREITKGGRDGEGESEGGRYIKKRE